MNMQVFPKMYTGRLLTIVCICSFFFLQAASGAGPTLQQTLVKIGELPSTTYSPEAYAYYTGKGTALPQQPPITEITATLLALVRITAHADNAKEIIPVLIASFPKVVHVTQIKNIRYTSEGTFGDWEYTYVASEKNKFLLASPFLDYNTMSLFENFINASHEVTRQNGEVVTAPTKDMVTISVTHTLYAAAYALTVLTGEQLGTDHTKWIEWWNANSETFTGPAAATSGAPSESPSSVAPTAYGSLTSGQQFSEIVLHGKYQLVLKTGTTLTGSVESKNDTSLILESTDGKAYTFKPTIISRFQLLALPEEKAPEAPVATDSLPFSFDELRGRRSSSRIIEVRVNSGLSFRGKCTNITDKMMQLDVGGSTIPISRDVTLNIRFVDIAGSNAAAAKAASPVKVAAPDTVYEKNTTTDDWGVPGPDIMHAGTITAEKPEQVIIKIAETGSEKTIPRGLLLRIIKHSSNNYDSEIKRYASALFCPQDMFIVDVPPGKEGRPFFKVCIDRYEFPNVKGAAPKTNISYDDAEAACRQKGKRLCSADEWQYGCSGIEGYTYPYGWNLDQDKCNGDDKRPPEESGNRYNCVSKFGGYDMVGNVFEWVTAGQRQPAMMGGPFSKCQTITEGVGGSAKPRAGFRCCKSN